MKAQLDGLGGVRGRPHAAHGLVAGVNRRRQPLAAQPVMRRQRQAGSNHRRARMAHRLVMRIVQLHAVRRRRVNERRQRRRQPQIRSQQRRVSRPAVRCRPLMQPPPPLQQRPRITASEMIENQIPDLRQITFAQRRVPHRQQLLRQRQTTPILSHAHAFFASALPEVSGASIRLLLGPLVRETQQAIHGAWFRHPWLHKLPDEGSEEKALSSAFPGLVAL